MDDAPWPKIPTPSAALDCPDHARRRSAELGLLFERLVPRLLRNLGVTDPAAVSTATLIALGLDAFFGEHGRALRQLGRDLVEGRHEQTVLGRQLVHLDQRVIELLSQLDLLRRDLVESRGPRPAF